MPFFIPRAAHKHGKTFFWERDLSKFDRVPPIAIKSCHLKNSSHRLDGIVVPLNNSRNSRWSDFFFVVAIYPDPHNIITSPEKKRTQLFQNFFFKWGMRGNRVFCSPLKRSAFQLGILLCMCGVV